MSFQAILNTDNVADKALPMNSMLKQSYDSAIKHLHGGVTVLQDGMNVIKDEFIGIYDKAATIVNKMALPVNNFLKDLTQIEAELQSELAVNSRAVRHTGCTIIPLEEALEGRMEENY
jgi:hypothetical protein